ERPGRTQAEQPGTGQRRASRRRRRPGASAAAPRHRAVGDPDGQAGAWRDPSQCAIRETLEETGVLTEITGILGVYSDPGHIVAYSDGEIRQEWELILLGRPVSGTSAANDEASEVGWFAPDQLSVLAIHPTQWRQLRDWQARAWPHID